MLKIIRNAVFAILFLLVFVFGTTVLINGNQAYFIVSLCADTNEDNLILLKYKVYATDEKFEKALDVDVRKEVDYYKEKQEILLVKIYGKEENVYRKPDYVLQTDANCYQLNIEYYLVKNMTIFGNNIPCYTFINYVSDKLFYVFLGISTVSFLSFTIFLLLFIKSIKKYKSSTKKSTE